jgi:large subunit ribosomal protein L22
MEAKAVAKNIGISPRKVRPVIDLVRGKKIDEALALLKFTPTPTAKAVAKVVKSAAANAENNLQLTPSDLKIVKIFADEARTTKRYRPVARGRANTIRKRASHITVIVAEEEQVGS